MVSPGLFATLGVPLLAGRDFAATDTASSPSVQRELLNILEAAVGRAPNTQRTGAGKAPRDAITIEELAEISQRLFPNGTESSVAYLRKMRESR